MSPVTFPFAGGGSPRLRHRNRHEAVEQSSFFTGDNAYDFEREMFHAELENGTEERQGTIKGRGLLMLFCVSLVLQCCAQGFADARMN